MRFSIDLPDWAVDDQATLPTHIPSVEEQMSVVIQFAQKNLEQRSGGPFAAGVFERESGRRIAIGVNRVVPLNMSSAHAEIVAISISQQLLATWDLGSKQFSPMQLVVNWRPCAMCYGAVLWSGIRSLVIAGSDDACERITGFDEGPIHPEWREELRKRDIQLHENVLYDRAIAVFQTFRDTGQMVYNSRRG